MSIDHATPLCGKFIVCERSGEWAVALRRCADDPAVSLGAARGLIDAGEQLASAPASFVVIELEPRNASQLPQAVARWVDRFPSARFAVVAKRPMADYEALMREAGAIDFVTSPRDLRGICLHARRHLALAAPAEPALREQLLARLPWPGE
jgi:hypothetical protein